MARAIYPGSFDPITYGHVDIIRRMRPLFDEFTVLVANSRQKNYMFTSGERVALAKECLKDLPDVRVEVHEGLTVDYARSVKADVIIRGLRVVTDFEYEMAMANMNRKLYAPAETLIVFASPEFNYVSSRMVKEVAQHGGDLKNLVPPEVTRALSLKLKSPDRP